MSQDVKDLLDASRIIVKARGEAYGVCDEAWTIMLHADNHLQKQLGVLLRQGSHANG